MKTIIIFDADYESIHFHIVEGDKSHLDGVYVNSSNSSEEQIDELINLIYDDVQMEKRPFITEFPKQIIIDDPETKVIVAGYCS